MKAVQNKAEKIAKKPMKSKTKVAPSAAPSVELYQMESCPFSHAVRNALSELGVDYIAHNVTSDLKHEQLVKAGGKDQIPFLIDHHTGMKLYESSAIVSYLNKEYGQMVEGFVPGLARKLEDQIRTRAEIIRWAVRTPVEKIAVIRRDWPNRWNDVAQTLSGTAKMVTETVRGALSSVTTEESSMGSAKAQKKAA